MKERLALLFLLLALPILVSASTFTRPLVVGSKGSDVSALQQILVNGGYLSTAPTGYFVEREHQRRCHMGWLVA
jgi:hypothetical protein